jgi:hypothetical protein
VAVIVAATGFASPAAAQPLAPISPLGPDGGPPARSGAVAGMRPDLPTPVLGAPVVVTTPTAVAAVAPVAFTAAADDRPRRAAAFGAPSAAGGPDDAPLPPPAPVPAAAVGNAARPANPPPASDPLADLLTVRSELKDRDPLPAAGPPKPDSASGKLTDDMADRLNGVFGTNSGGWFRGDHLFDFFISPVSNPFLFEDPRALTEVRPLFIFQKVPSSQPDFHGGNVTFFGTQARVAFGEQWSLVVNKFGGIAVNTNSPSPFHDQVGFAEIWLGPKWTFYRSEENLAVAAAGLTLQIPVGSKDTFQNTGTLTLAPYASYAQNLFHDFSLGSFNVMANTGVSLSTNKERTDYLWLSGHVDMDVNNSHRYYPLFELNWLLNAANGSTTPIGAEGRDLINFGGHPKGSGLLTAAFGGRVKVFESAQIGAAFEIPIAGQRDLFDYRFTIDFILRY